MQFLVKEQWGKGFVCTLWWNLFMLKVLSFVSWCRSEVFRWYGWFVMHNLIASLVWFWEKTKTVSVKMCWSQWLKNNDVDVDADLKSELGQSILDYVSDIWWKVVWRTFQIYLIAVVKEKLSWFFVYFALTWKRGWL